jgi:hypothetical protein
MLSSKVILVSTFAVFGKRLLSVAAFETFVAVLSQWLSKLGFLTHTFSVFSHRLRTLFTRVDLVSLFPSFLFCVLPLITSFRTSHSSWLQSSSVVTASQQPQPPYSLCLPCVSVHAPCASILNVSLW